MQIYQGLNTEQVQESRRQHGENTMTPPERIPAWRLFLQKFNDPIIKLLLFATLLSFITGYFHGSFAESFGILIAVFLATFLSFINEYRAAREFDVLNQINDSVLVKVYREGHVVMIPKTEIVVGDYVIVEQGDEIPADGVVVEVMSLSVNESTLNGESVPVFCFFKTLAATAVSISLSVIAYFLTERALLTEAFALTAAILVAGITYAFVAIKFGVIGIYEIGHLPFGDRMIPILRKLKLLK